MLPPTTLAPRSADPSRLWRALGLPSQRAPAPEPIFEPRRTTSFHELVGLHLGPAESVLVVCVDERRQPASAAAADEADEAARAPALAREARRLGLLLEALGAVTGADRYDAIDDASTPARVDVRPLLALLDHLDRAVPPDLDVHLIVDRRASCRDPAVRGWFAGRRRFHVHFAVDHRRWRERAAGWLRFAAGRQRVLGAPRVTLALESAVQRFVRRPPTDRVFTWTRSGDELLTQRARFQVRRGG